MVHPAVDLELHCAGRCSNVTAKYTKVRRERINGEGRGDVEDGEVP